MNLMAKDLGWSMPYQASRMDASSRDSRIDTMRGIAILMVIGIHSFQQPLNSWAVPADAALRPCVPIFLFASGYLTARSGRVPLWKRLRAALIPYAIAFVAAYIYMALHNPVMDHRIVTTVARFILAYAFVYYYVFVYVGCTLGLWLVFSASRRQRFQATWRPVRIRKTRQVDNAESDFDSIEMEKAQDTTPSEARLVVLLLLAIALGLIAGSYLDPLLSRLGLSDSVVEEVRMRDIPFWFSFMAIGALIEICETRSSLHDMRVLISGATLLAFIIYATVRLFGLGDAADYDSIAFFGYAALLCILLFALDVRSPYLAGLGSGSYFIYLWHIFIIMILRDHVALHRFGPVANFAITYAVTALGSIFLLLAIRATAPPRMIRWLGA
jgi:fucose 4-O-acetylase-like acetyltransferase